MESTKLNKKAQFSFRKKDVIQGRASYTLLKTKTKNAEKVSFVFRVKEKIYKVFLTHSNSCTEKGSIWIPHPNEQSHGIFDFVVFVEFYVLRTDFF